MIKYRLVSKFSEKVKVSQKIRRKNTWTNIGQTDMFKSIHKIKSKFLLNFAGRTNLIKPTSTVKAVKNHKKTLIC